MRATFRNLLEAKRREREEETGEAGFSLIELIIVIVIIGILAAIAIPIFSNIQKNANDSAAQSAAANGATTAAVDASKVGSTLAAGQTYPELVEGNVTAVTLSKYTAGDLSTICVTATLKAGTGTQASWSAGPGAATAANGSTSCP